MQASAHGKIIWIGEHACVYGFPAIVSSINLDVCVDESKVTTDFDEFIKYAIKMVNGHNMINIFGDLPKGTGLGYSTAVLVAIARFFKADDPLKYVIDVEKHFNPSYSGVDAVACLNDGVFFVKGNDLNDLPDIFFDYFVVNTGCVDKTADMTDYVSKVSDKDRHFAAIHDACKIFENALLSKDLASVYEAVTLASDALIGLGIVELKGQKLLSYLHGEGFAAKVTGAGGLTDGSGAVVGIGTLSIQQKEYIQNNLGFKIVYES